MCTHSKSSRKTKNTPRTQLNPIVLLYNRNKNLHPDSVVPRPLDSHSTREANRGQMGQ